MKTISVASALALVLAFAAGAEAQDVIRLRSGSELKVKITGMTSQSVTYAEGAKVSTAKAEDVASLELGEKPPSLVKADTALANSQYDRAINNFQPALDEIAGKKARELHKQFVYLAWGQALAQKGSPTEALDMFRRLRNEGGDCWLRAESFRRSLDVAKAKGGDAYEAVLKEMKGEPEPVGSQAELEIAKIRYTAADFDAARAGFDKIGNNATSIYSGDAKLWSLRCIRALKKMDELESACTRILGDKTNNPPALLQSAGASLADIQLKKAEKDKTKWRDILMLAIQSIALGPPSGKEEGEDYALALLTGAKAYVLLSTDTEKAEAKEEYKTRAIGYYKEVRGAYRGTAAAEIATKELVALGEAAPPGGAPKEPKSDK